MVRQYFWCLILAHHASALKAPNASKTLATRARGAGAVVAVSGAALVAVSIDVNTLHVVAPAIDDAARTWASNHAAGNENSLGRVLSDIAPGLGVPCAAASLALVARRGADALRVVAPLGVGFGAFVQGLSGVLKDATQRVRPDPLHHSTYSFPSSHTASATFLAGAFLAVLLPALLDDDDEDTDGKSSHDEDERLQRPSIVARTSSTSSASSRPTTRTPCASPAWPRSRRSPRARTRVEIYA